MTVTVKFLVCFFLGYVLFKGVLFWRLHLALRRMVEKQKALADRPSFDFTRRRDESGQPPRALEL